VGFDTIETFRYGVKPMEHDEHAQPETTGEGRADEYEAGSLSLIGAVSLGTSVMIGAGIFALTGQMPEMAGSLFPLAFLAATVVVAFSAYSYVKLSNTWPPRGASACISTRRTGTAPSPPSMRC